MRAIDGDALRDRFQNLAYDDWNQGASTSWADAYRECADVVEEMPTIEERKPGRWINKRYRWLDCISMWWINSYECSACGAAGLHDWKFCPNCGADMRGEQDEL